VDEIFPQILVSGAELGARGDNLGLPAVLSEILMELTTLISFSFVLMGAGGVLAGDDFIQQCFNGFDLSRSFLPA